MGVSNDGVLVFGIDFGEELPDFPNYDDCDDFEDFITKESGLPEWEEGMTNEESGLYWSKKQQMVKDAPVNLTFYCTYDYPMYILNIPGYEYSASRGYVEEVSETNMVVPQEKIDAMKTWCEDHSIEWSEPKWLLCSMNG